MLKLKVELCRHLPEHEAELVLLHVFRTMHPHLKSFSDLKILQPISTPEIRLTALEIARARENGVPLQHLIGVQFFFEHEYAVNASTLVPRPETEVLVQEALNYLREKKAERAFTIAELGIGSGVIIGEILSHFKNARAHASEVSPGALDLARRNLLGILGKDFEQRIEFHTPPDASVGFEIFLNAAPFDLIVSNPPYLSTTDEISPEVTHHEPHLALFPVHSGKHENPNYFYENFLTHARKILASDGVVFFEIPNNRAEVLRERFLKSGFRDTRLIPDLTGRPRVLQARF